MFTAKTMCGCGSIPTTTSDEPTSRLQSSGIQQDGIYTEGQDADFSVDIVMESKGVIEDWGWSVEVKIPFKSLRYSGGKGKIWGFNVVGSIDRFNDEFDQWMPEDRNVSGFLVKSGKITGLDEIKDERTLEIVPSITFRRNRQPRSRRIEIIRRMRIPAFKSIRSSKTSV